MRIFVSLLFALCFYSCKAQNEEVQRIDLKVDIQALKQKGAQFGNSRVLAVDENFAIGQFGMSDIALFDLESGNIIKTIESDVVIKSIEQHIHCLLGNHYYVPDTKEYLRRTIYAGAKPYGFRGLMFLEEKGKFVTNMFTVAFNRNDESEQLLFLSLALFDHSLGNIEIIPFDPRNSSTESGWIHGGFFLGQDRMFTKMLAWSHNFDFDFHEYRLTDDQLYTLSDSLVGIKTSTFGYVGRFHGCFEFQDRSYLNLGSMLYSFEEGKIKEGAFVQFPQKDERTFVYIEPIDENRLLAYAVNNYRFDPNPTGWLLLLDKNLAIMREIHAFDLREAIFCSLFTSGKSWYIAKYNQKKEKYFLLKYEDL